jgi:DNA/RNA-binding domain of Phe-tRNA-synthetase-like protein
MMHSPSIRFQTGVPGTAITLITLDELKPGKSSSDFEEYEQTLFKEIRTKNKLDDLSTDPLLQSYRAMHWTYGMDPTKKRVSSEAVLRRVLQGENLWRIFDLVDVVNLASAYHKIPIGLIDASKVKGDLVVRVAKKGEIFQRISGEIIKCRGREIVLGDDIGIVCYGFAIHDSERTKVTSGSQSVLLLHYGTSAVTSEILMEASHTTLNMVRQWVECVPSKPIRFVSTT